MRWFVEISPLGASEGQKQKWCLEAAGWQPALKDARSLRGEEGPLGGFSIELLDDGARAVDPVTRIRYVIRSAPDDAPLTHTKDGAVNASPSAKAAPATAEPAKSEPAKAELPKSEPAKAEPAKAEPAKAEPAKAEPAKAAPVEVEPADAEAGSEDVDIPIDEDEGDGADVAPLPEYQVLQAREENPNDRSPLTYREYVYSVGASTSDAEIERLLHARFEAVKRDLEGAKQGRFVNLAIFDHAFTGKPAKRPRATLAWKDWRGGPEIRFPTAERASLEPPSFSAPTSFSKPIPQPSIPPQEPVSLVPSTAVAPTEPVPAQIPSAPAASKAAAPAAPAGAPANASPPVAAEHAAAPPAASVAPVISSAPATPAVSTEPSREVAPATTAAKAEKTETPAAAKAEAADAEKTETPAPAKNEAPAAKAEAPDAKTDAPAPKIEAPAAVKIEAAPAASVAQPSVPVSAIPKTMPAAASPPAAAGRREAYIPTVKTAAQVGRRMAGDELIAELFEACGDLQFVRDSLEGADFVLALALEKLPSEVGLVSLFDINRREFVVVRQAGGPRSIVLSRLPERAGLAQPAMRKKAALVVSEASKEPRALDDRFRTLGIELVSLMVAPVEVSGRYLGLIELCNPVDGRAFTEGDGHALTYIGEQYAEFVAERGVILDPDSVLERHQKR